MNRNVLFAALMIWAAWSVGLVAILSFAFWDFIGWSAIRAAFISGAFAGAAYLSFQLGK